MISLFIGWPGTGKTQLMCDYVSAQSETHKFFVVDRACEWGVEDWYGEPNPRWRGTPPRIEIVDPPRTDGEVSERVTEADTGVFLFRTPWTPEQVSQLCCDVGNVVYTDDEIDIAASKRGWPENPIREIVHRGRHLENSVGDMLEVHIVGAARRPQSLHTDLTEIADQAFIFKVGGSRTLRRLQDDSWIEDSDWPTIRAFPGGPAYRGDLKCLHWPSRRVLMAPNAFSRGAKKHQHARRGLEQ